MRSSDELLCIFSVYRLFKKKTKKAYKKKIGHRQWLTEIKIEGISLN